MSQQEPLVYRWRGAWWHLDETFDKRNAKGSFDTEEEAADACIKYFEQLTGLKIQHFLRD